jgi:hypothetical protein
MVNFMKLTTASLEKYLQSIYEKKAKIHDFYPLGIGIKSQARKDLKGFGYGLPYVIEFSIENKIKKVVLETMRSEGFGHDHFSDRAQILLWQHSAFNKLPRHVRSVDVGAFTKEVYPLMSLGKCREFFLLTEHINGSLYHLDLDRIKKSGKLGRQDEKRCLALSDYLIDIHKLKKEAPQLYVRRARELVGNGECIMGLLDSYPPQLEFIKESDLIEIEKDCVVWRWSLKHKTHRLSQVHGDFHPWNILFREAADFTVLDRSRGDWGEPAGDIAAITINYLFYSLQNHGELCGAFDRLFQLFWANYLEKTGDMELLEVIQPFYAWRSLVLASPVWYPTLSRDVRINLMNFTKRILQSKVFDLNEINSYVSGT